MRVFGIIICGVLLSVQGFAFKGGTGKNAARHLKEMLRNQPLIEKVAALNGESSVAINSRNLGVKILSAAVGVGLLFAVNAADANNIEKRVNELDKKIGSAKVIDLGNETELDISGKIVGNYAGYGGSHEGKDDSLTAGIGIDASLRHALSQLTLSGKIISNNTKRAGEEDFNGTVDYSGRAAFVQGLPVYADSIINPSLFGEVGGAQYGNIKRQAVATAGVGLSTSHEIFGKTMELYVRSGFGGLWEGKYGAGDEADDSYGDLEGDSVFMFGATLKTGWVSMATFLGAEEGTILDYIPAIPNAVTTYTQYHPLGDGEFDEPTRSLESTISIINGLGVTIDYNKKSGEEAHKSILASLTYNLF